MLGAASGLAPRINAGRLARLAGSAALKRRLHRTRSLWGRGRGQPVEPGLHEASEKQVVGGGQDETREEEEKKPVGRCLVAPYIGFNAGGISVPERGGTGLLSAALLKNASQLAMMVQVQYNYTSSIRYQDPWVLTEHET